METLVIYRSVNRDGATYTLSRRARELVEDRFPRSLSPKGRVFLARSPNSEEEINDLQVQALVSLLAALSPEERSQFQVQFVDPALEPG